MRLEYLTKRQEEVSMTPYTKKELDKFPEEITTTAPTPETENLFKFQYEKDRISLTEKQAEQFHHVVAQILFASGRVRRDL